MQFINRKNFCLQDYELTAAEFLLKRKERPKPIVLDLRPLKESMLGMVDGSHALPYEELEERLIQLPPFGSIVFYSDEQNQNIENALKMLWETGFTDLFYVDGGYKAILRAFVDIDEANIAAIGQHLKQNKKNALQLEIKAGKYIFHEIDSEPNPETFKKISYPDWALFFQHTKMRLVEGLTLRYEQGSIQADHPVMHRSGSGESLKQRVQKLLDEQINPSVASHGGVVNLIDVVDDVVYVEMGGGCQGCGMSAVTLKQGVEHAIFSEIPEISQVLDKTDHSAGANPYYA